MARFGNETVEVGAIGIRGRGVTGDATEGIATTRGERRRALDAAIPSDGFVERAQITLVVDGVSGGTRGGGASPSGEYEAPAVLVGPAQAAPGELGQIALVDDGGFCYIIRPIKSGEDAGCFEIPIGDGLDAHRGLTQLAGRFAVRIVGLFAKKAVEHGTALAIQAIEQRVRPCRLRSFVRTDHRREPDRTGAELLEGGPALLLIHGVNSNSIKAFGFDDAYVEEIGTRYGGRIAAFDHPSLAFDPRVNAEWLAEQLDGKDLHEIDILAHCRGGLVARELLALLGSRSDIVRSVVFVATPNNGTPLADADRIDGFLSMATNVTAVMPDNPITDAIGIALEVVREYATGVLKAIDGITCMMPGSEQLRALAKHGSGDTAFRAIATHYEPRSEDGRLRRAADYVMDKAFRGQANDLLVPTRSTYLPSSRFQVPVDQRLVLASSFGVSHCTFWPDARVRRQLDQWLDPGIAVDAAASVESEHTDPAAEIEEATYLGRSDLAPEAHERLRGDARSRGATTQASAGRGTVILLPGILGSRLRVARSDAPASTMGELVWFNKWSLVRGGFRRLRVGDEQHRVTPDGLMKEYAPLVSHLASWWDVHPFAYDWRLPIDDLAGHLGEFLDERGIDVGAADEPVHLVGHSMGGLVARAYIGMHRERWERGSGRLVQLGTPNWGSFAMVAAVLGDEWAVRALAAADVFGSKDDVLRVFRSFPSVYQLFPSPLRALAEGGEPPHAALYGPEGAWYRRDGDAGEASSVRNLIAAAKAFHTTMATVRGDDRVVFVAGDSQPTPYRARIDASGKVSFGVTRRGDGRVPHDFGYADMDIADECTFFVETRHGDLASDERVLRAIDDLLERGTTDSLAKQPAGGVRAVPEDDTSWVDSGDLERSLGLLVPSAARDLRVGDGAVDDGLDLTVGLYLGGRPKQPTGPSLRVRVVHGSMEQAKYAVAAGRYKGIPIDGALAYLNHRLGDALRDLQDLDLLPEDAGSAYYVPPLDISTYPKGAIVVGLGEFGQLSATRLARAMERGTIEYALAQRSSKQKPTIGVSAVLIGTPGRYGLSVENALLAMVQGVARAAARLKDTVLIDELEFIELYEGKAEEAAMAVAKLAVNKRFEGTDVPILPEFRLVVRPGARPGSGGYEQTGEPWLRLQLDFEDPTPEPDPAADTKAKTSRSRKLKWVSLGRSSQAEHLEVDLPMEEIRRHVRSAVRNPGASGATNLTLFEMLFPHDAKLDLDEKDNLHLLVDSSTAWIPWEVVTGRDTGGKLLPPLSLRAGVLRQLKPRQAERPRRNFLPIGKKALVIGDPPTNLVRLAGARTEARVVADLLERDGYEVTRRIYDDGDKASDEVAADIRNAFFAEHYRFIHIAAHGVYDDESTDPFARGVVIGNLDDGQLLTAHHFAQRLVRPDLVFLNCCHVGRIDDQVTVGPTRRIASSELAASMSIELMRSGIRAVVAAGWAVDDTAALKFAERFYSSMINGYAYGESVNVARKACYDESNNTWGAYQCYGDPGFQFFGAPRRSSAETGFVLSESHLVKRIEILAKKAGDQMGKRNTDDVADELRTMEDQYGDEFGSAAVWEAFGRAYAEAGAFDSAVWSYRTALSNRSTNTRVIEQLANLEARLAAMIKRGEPIPRPRITESPTELCRQAETRLKPLFALVPNAEHFVIKGSLYKRWASIGGRGRSKVRDLRVSRDAYAAAADLASRGSTGLSVYQACLAMQMAYIAATAVGTTPELEVQWFAEYRTRLTKQRSHMDTDNDEGDYFTRARPVDIDATLIIADGQIADPANADRIVEGFKSTFRIRSSARDRLSVEHHYRELAELLPVSQRETARAIANRLGDH